MQSRSKLEIQGFRSNRGDHVHVLRILESAMKALCRDVFWEEVRSGCTARIGIDETAQANSQGTRAFSSSLYSYKHPGDLHVHNLLFHYDWPAALPKGKVLGLSASCECVDRVCQVYQDVLEIVWNGSTQCLPHPYLCFGLRAGLDYLKRFNGLSPPSTFTMKRHHYQCKGCLVMI
jgi:hypothetical protein